MLYNFYNPFLALGPTHPINVYGNPLIISINQSLEVLKIYGQEIADAYSIGLDPLNNLLLGDIHPSFDGHEMLAQMGLKALNLK